MKKFDMRGFVSVLLAIDFVVITITGIGLFVSPSGRIADEIGFKFLGMNKDALESIHVVFGYLMVVLVAVHLYYNWKIFLNYFWKLIVGGVRRIRLVEGIVAIAVAVFLFLSGLYGFPPSSTLSDIGEKLSIAIEKSYRAEIEGTDEEYVKIGIRGYMTVSEAAKNLGVSLETALQRLKDAGITAKADDTIKDLMNKYNLTSYDIESIIEGGGE